MKFLMPIIVMMSICHSALAMNSEVKACYDVANSMYYDNTRDSARFQCIKRNQATISPEDCMTIASSMHYSDNQDKARFQCLKVNGITRQQCVAIANSMYYDNNRDSARLFCHQ